MPPVCNTLSGLRPEATAPEESKHSHGENSYYYFNVPKGEEAAPKVPSQDS